VTPPSDLEGVAGAILDGAPVDWVRVDAEAAPTDRPLIDQLKTLAALRQVAGRVEPPPGLTASWGHLRVLERIGRGAFGTVYRAWDTRLDREVALKLLSFESAGPDSPESTVIEEGRLLARIRHPNVVTIYGAERMDGRVGLWMELVKGRTLEHALRDGATFTSREVMHIGTDLCRAVAAVHAAGLLHRDIKAQNVMMEETGRLVLMDFGTGRELGGAPDTDVTGTPLYLAPEVLAGNTATARSDVYSIGVVLYRLLTGSYPVQGRDLADLRRAHAAGEHTALPSSRRDIPTRFRRVIERALDHDPERRHAGADAFAEALLALRRAPTSRRWVLSAVATVAVVLLGVVGWGQWSRNVAPLIAVMPFENVRHDPGDDYFVDGLTDEVIRNLAAIDGVQVRSQTSSFWFKDKPRDLHAIANQLRVNFIVEAKISRVDNRLRITAQLVHVPDDVLLWSEAFDRPVDDVFAIQEDISRAIASALRLTLNRGQQRYRTNLPAYEGYLRARAAVSRRGNESARQAAHLFEQVIAMDRTFAPAHAGLADAYAEMSWQLTGLSPAEALRHMRPAAELALKLDPMLAEAHAAMAMTCARELDWERSAREFEEAIEKGPTLTQIQANYALMTLVPTGQLQKAQQLLVRALSRDPLSSVLQRDLGWVQFDAGRFNEAIGTFRKALADDPSLPFATQGLARSLMFAGRSEEAIDVWKHRPPSDDWERRMAFAYVQTGRRAEIERLIEAHKSAHPYHQAIIYAALGDKDRVFEALNRAVDVAPNRTAQELTAPEMALLRGDPRLDALRKRLNLQ
jgi:serine/threonine-protein kinase